MIYGYVFLMVICVAAGFNIFTTPEKHFQREDDSLFGQTIIQSSDGVLVTSPRSATQILYHCTKQKCTEVNIKAFATKGLKPIVSVAKNLEGGKHVVCQQVRKRKTINENLNGLCTILSNLQSETEIDPASLMIKELNKTSSNSNNNNNNNNKDSLKEELFTPNSVAGREIAFVLDGSGSIEPDDFERAKEFISNVMKNTWKMCYDCNFEIVQYGADIRTELSLMESYDKEKALEKVKELKQIGSFTRTASAINHVLEHVFVAENWSSENSAKIIIVITDGRIFLDPMNLTDVLNSPKMKNILRFAIGVGDVTDDKKAIEELEQIASDPNEKYLHMVDNYAALDGLSLKLENTITWNDDQSLLHQKGQSSKNNNNNNNNIKDENEDEDEDDEDAGTEIAFVLDGSGSIEPDDFEKAKEFISNVMETVWKTCFVCDFAIVQYGADIRTELSILENNNGTKAVEKVKKIKQIGKYTKTASAINHVLEHVFVAENGSKENSRKIIIVLTDGRIFLDNMNLTDVLNSTKMKNVLRFAIGVGNVTNDKKGIEELEQIASDPKENHLHMVDNYAALDSILSKVEKTIIGIEGIQQGAAFLFDLAEAGFSTHFAHDGTLLFGAVGAYDWSGGLILKNPSGAVMFLNDSSSEPRFSYLGYSVVSVNGINKSLYVSGAPRYNLTGSVLVFNSSSQLIQRLLGDQVGSYFGAELCALNTKIDGNTDYLLVGAPFFHSKGEEGKVYVYKLDQGQFHKETFEWQGVDEFTFSRFGSAIASIGDIDGDGYNDVAVGAPLEGEETSASFGSIYIYNGYEGGIRSRYSQRISASDLGRNLRYFGRSVSGMYHPGKIRQQLISVGSEGGVTVLRALDVLIIEPQMTVDPKVLPQFDNIGGNTYENPISLKICFSTKRGDIKSGHLPISYEVNLDVSQVTKRLSFGNSASKKDTFTLTPERNCLSQISLTFVPCYDCFSPIEIKLNYSLPHNQSEGAPVRVLDQFSPTEHTINLPFKRDCEKCVANISLSGSELSLDRIVVGHTQDLSISFSLTNTGDASYRTVLVLTYPSVLLFNVLSKKTGHIVCKNEVREADSEIKCDIAHPVMKKSTQANFSISWQLSDKKPKTRTSSVMAVLTCENDGTQVLDRRNYTFEVKSALNVHIDGSATPPSLTVFKKDKEKPLEFRFEIHGENKYNGTIRVSINITVQGHTNLHITKVQSSNQEKKCDDSGKLNGNVHCDVNELPVTVHIDAKALIQNAEVTSEKILADATLSFDETQYEATRKTKHRDRVEVFLIKGEIVQSTSTIIGGSIGGFLLLAIIIAILVKCGFFRSRYATLKREREN